MFKLQAVETQGARWINENLFNSEVYATKLCPDGVLCRPCPKCGKEYGRSWYFKTIPADEVKKIKLIMGQKD